MSPATRVDPFLVKNFLVEIDGVTSAAFSEVSGIDVSTDPIDYREGNAAENAVRKLSGLNKFTNITLKRGLTQDLSLWNWMQNTLNGNVQRTSVSIVLLDQDRNPVWRWSLTNAWPCKWAGPALNAQSNDVAIETLEICYEGLSVSGGN
jgi:phage tail-like protein